MRVPRPLPRGRAGTAAGVASVIGTATTRRPDRRQA